MKKRKITPIHKLNDKKLLYLFKEYKNPKNKEEIWGEMVKGGLIKLKNKKKRAVGNNENRKKKDVTNSEKIKKDSRKYLKENVTLNKDPNYFIQTQTEYKKSLININTNRDSLNKLYLHAVMKYWVFNKIEDANMLISALKNKNSRYTKNMSLALVQLVPYVLQEDMRIRAKRKKYIGSIIASWENVFLTPWYEVKINYNPILKREKKLKRRKKRKGGDAMNRVMSGAGWTRCK